MMSKKEVAHILEKVLNWSSAEQTEVILISQDSALTRFSNSSIHQNVTEKNVHLALRAIVNRQQIGYSATNQLDDSSLKKAIKKAIEVAKYRPKDSDFKSLPSPKTWPKLKCCFPFGAEGTPEKRAETVLSIIYRATQNNLDSAGALSLNKATIGIANSLGIKAIDSFSEVFLKATLMSDGGSGYAEQACRDISKLDVSSVATTAIQKALAAQDPINLPPGNYPTILEPAAVADMLMSLALCGLGAKSLQEGRSFLKSKLGKKIVSKQVTIWDDALDSRTLQIPFDFEGVPKQKVVLIKNGLAKAVVYDSYTAQKENRKSTGHGLPAPNPYGPLPTHLFMKTGSSSLEEMIASTKRGLLVSRFHYTNLEDPMKTTLTGMTRDGTFLIEDGQIKGGVKNLRFTQNILEALSQIELISKDSELKRSFFGLVCAPTVKLSGFNFTGVTS